MELVVGENSYISLDEANDLIKQIYLSSDENRKFWDSLSDEDKTTLILNATTKIENSRNLWIGSKVDPKTKMSFPRIEYNGHKLDRLINFDKTLKQGLVRLAIEGYRLEHSDENSMIEKGISSYKIKDASVTFDVSDKRKIRTETGIPVEIWKLYFAQYSLIS